MMLMDGIRRLRKLLLTSDLGGLLATGIEDWALPGNVEETVETNG